MWKGEIRVKYGVQRRSCDARNNAGCGWACPYSTGCTPLDPRLNRIPPRLHFFHRAYSIFIGIFIIFQHIHIFILPLILLLLLLPFSRSLSSLNSCPAPIYVHESNPLLGFPWYVFNQSQYVQSVPLVP